MSAENEDLIGRMQQYIKWREKDQYNPEYSALQILATCLQTRAIEELTKVVEEVG